MKLLKLIETAALLTINGKACVANVSPEIGDPENQILFIKWAKGYANFTERLVREAWEHRGKYQIQCVKGDWHELKIN